MKAKHILFATALALFSCKQGTKTESQTAETTEKQAVWDTSYGGADKAYDTELLAMRAEIAPKFQRLAFEDETTGRTMYYNLFTPKSDDENQKYPLVLFMADASTVGKSPQAPLMQGYGGIIWATDESQAENPSFVLVPEFAGPESAVNDKSQTTDEVGIALRLLEKIVSTHAIDRNRLYTTGQSMGGMISFYFNATHPDLFAASLFVGSQWDINVLKPLEKEKFFYIVSAGDEKASAGMANLENLFKTDNIAFGQTQFSAKLSQAEQEANIQQLLNEGFERNFVKFDKNTVIPTGDSQPGAEHMYSFDYAYKLKKVREWLFRQTK
ncbi:MAG: hypothetical protein Q4G16_02555 [Cruoricaptor ignavus]|nr:hypothetical protein [Cruoricaptor ignavus]